MRMHRAVIGSVVAVAAVIGAACNSDSPTAASGTNGSMLVKLTDAPFPTDSVDSVNVYVTRVDVRAAAADSTDAATGTTSDSSSARGWITVASPAKVFNLISLQNGVTADLGLTTLAAGTYNAMRLVIDPSKSSVVLHNGMKLTGTSSPGVTFPSGASSGIKVSLSNGLTVVAHDTVKATLDFNLDQSFVLRGNSITQLGLLFKPVIQATVSN